MTIGWSAVAGEQPPPNFIVIFTDDQGYQDLGCYGSPDIATPHIDRMAARGMRFTDFYVACPVCTPSRGALLTGKYPDALGPAKGVLFPHSDSGLPPEEITIAELLKRKDYATACIGKWHLGHRDPFLPTSQGFDLFYGLPCSNDMWLDPELKAADDIVLTGGMTLEKMESLRSWKENEENNDLVPLMRGNRIVEFPADQATLTRRFAEEVIGFIEQKKQQPFFVYFAPAMPHIPLFASEEFKGKSKGGLYGDTIEEIDAAVGRILQYLDEQGLSENTLVVFASDNGPWLSMGERGGRALPLAGGKGSGLEGGVRVPCIMQMPGTIPAGAICSEPAGTIDLLPTFGKLADLPVSHPIDGKDIGHLLRGEFGASSPHEFILYYLPNDGFCAIRMGDWKLIHSMPSTTWWQKHAARKYDPNAFGPELYNLSEDIGETRNLYNAYPEIAERLMQRAVDEQISRRARLGSGGVLPQFRP
jgi:arylsulfatase A-like enzyme